MSRRRAIFLTQAFPPETHAGANRAAAVAGALGEVFALTVVAPAPSHPTPEYHADRPIADLDAERPYRVLRIGPFRPHSAGYLRRGAREIRLAVDLALRGRGPADVVVATSPSFFLGPMAYLLARWARATFVWDVRDLTWEYARQALSEITQRRRLRMAATFALTRTARFVARHADVFWASNEGIAGFARPLRHPSRSTAVVPNGVGQTLFRALRPVADAEPPPYPPRVTYAGALGYYQGLDTLLEVAASLPATEFWFVGDGPERLHLERRAAEADLGNVTFTGYVDRPTLFDIYRTSHVLFAQLRDLPVMTGATVPSKIYEYLAAGRPVVYAGGGVAADIARTSGGALVVEPQRPAAIRRALVKLLDDPVLCRNLGRRGRRFAGAHVREEIMRAAVARLYDGLRRG